MTGGGTKGLRVLCVSNMWPGARDPDYGAFVATMCDALEARGLVVERAVIDSRARGALRTPAKYAALAGRAVARGRRADVVYAHFLFPTGAAAAAAARAARVPHVITAHGQDVRNLARPAVRRASGPAVAGAAAVIAVSRYLAGELRASGLPLPPVHVVNMGVDTSRFTPLPRAAARALLGLGFDDPMIVAVGGLTERKNPLVLLQAFARVRAAQPGARLALVGDGPLARAVDAGARRLGVADGLLRPGAVPHATVREWIAAADALAIVSRVEPLGIAALEALAMERPVVATAVGGVREVVPAPAAGRIVDPADPTAIAAALLDVLDRPPAPGACRRAAEAHAVARQAARVAEILARAAAAGRVSGRGSRSTP